MEHTSLFDPTGTILEDMQDNPYASFDLEEESKKQQKLMIKESEQKFAATT